MIRAKMPKIGAVLVTFISAVILLSSCDALFDKSKEEIKLVAESYLAEIQNLSFAKNGYKSDYSTEVIEEPKAFYDARSKDVMLLSMENMTYEVVESYGSKKTGEGICNINITMPDNDKMITGGSEDLAEFSTYEEYMDKATSSEIRMKTTMVSFYLKYNQEKNAWVINDTGDLKNMLVNNFTTLKFGYPAGLPEDRINQMFTALAAGDLDMLITMIDEDFVHNNLFPLVAGTTDYALAVFSTYKYTITDARIIDGTHAEVDVEISFADEIKVQESYMSNEEKIIAIYKNMFIQAIGGKEITDEDEVRAFVAEISEEIRSPEAPMCEESITFLLETDLSGSFWTLPVVPAEFFPPLPQDEDFYVPDSFYYSCLRSAITELYEEERVTSSQYNGVLADIDDMEAGEAV